MEVKPPVESKPVVVNNAIKTDDVKVSTLFEMIKNTSLKDIMNDDDIFFNNNKFLNDAKQKRKDIIEKLQTKRLNGVDVDGIKSTNPKAKETIVDNKQVNKQIDIKSTSPVSPISIQDVNEINLDIDYDLDSDLKGNSNEITNSNENILENTEVNILENEDTEENTEEKNILENENIEEDNAEEENILENDEDIDLDNDAGNNDADNNDEDKQSNSSDDGIDYNILNDLEVVVFDE